MHAAVQLALHRQGLTQVRFGLFEVAALAIIDAEVTEALGDVGMCSAV